MSTVVVLSFMQKTSEDAGLRETLEKLLGVGDGDISNVSELDEEEAAALVGDRGPKVVEFATKQGYQFTLEDLIYVVKVFQRYQDGEISEDEFATAFGSGEIKDLSGITQALKRLAQYMSKTYLGIDF